MKKNVGIIFFLIVFLSPSISFSAPDDFCYWMTTCASNGNASQVANGGIVGASLIDDGNGWYTVSYDLGYESGTFFYTDNYLKFYVWDDQNLMWREQTDAGITGRDEGCAAWNDIQNQLSHVIVAPSNQVWSPQPGDEEQCFPPCEEERNQLEQACGGSQNVDWFDPALECTGSCKSCSDLIAAAQESCPNGIKEYNCSDHINADGNVDELIVDPEPVCNETCNDLGQQCIDDCGGASNIATYSCTETDGVVSLDEPCTCIVPPGGDSQPPEDEVPETDQPDPDSDEPDPSDLDNTLLQKIVKNTSVIAGNTRGTEHNTAKIVSNTNETNQILYRELNEANDNLGNIKDALDAAKQSTDEGNGLLESIDDRLRKANEKTDEISAGDFVQPTTPEPYVNNDLDDSVATPFTDRFSEFLDALKTTPLFSLPQDYLGNIPTGGDSVYTVDFGTYGSQSLDLSDFSSSFLIIKSVLMICFSFASVRIVLSKR